MRKNWRIWHRNLGILSLVPFLIILVSGIVLLFRSNLPSIHPPSSQGTKLPWDNFLSAQEISRINNIDHSKVTKIIFFPQKGYYSFLDNTGIETHMDAADGKILYQGNRHTSWIIAIHEGSYLGKPFQVFFYYPAIVIILLLFASGIYGLSHRKVSKKGKRKYEYIPLRS